MPKPSFRSIDIINTADGLAVLRPAPLEPFLLPRFPLTQVNWLTRVSAVFLKTHQRCMVASLMLNPRHEHWVEPQIIPQRCGRDGATWTHRDGDYAHRSKQHRIGGTYQSANVQSLTEALSLVPQFDGIHMVSVRNDPSELYVFVHYETDVHVLDFNRFFIDDVEAELELYDVQMERV